MLELRRSLVSGRVPSKAMEDGALMDQLLYGGQTFCEAQTCTKRSGPEKGQTFEPEDWTSADAQEQRKAARARGQVCCLAHEVDLAECQKQSMVEALLADGVDLVNSHTRCLGEELRASIDFAPAPPGVYTQPLVLWTSPEGVECQGTLDILQVFADGSWRVVDTKLSMRADEEWVSRQAADMGWYVQAGAYFEACVHGLNLDPVLFRGHAIAVCEKRSKLSMSAVHWLEPIAMHCAELEWHRCKVAWQHAIENDEWPGVAGSKLSPPGYYVSRVCEGESGESDLSDLGLDLSDVETEES
jgi:hypothetical protein